ncbi:hypothetical protein HYR54_11190 [Candidatus Acetothermia bacterium]|nr:hypothetical protein [Candidatus Acetothermia bacterium]
MMIQINLKKAATVGLLTIVAFTLSAGLLMAQADRTNEDANAMASYFKIGNRPTVITADDAQLRISHFPSFGDKSVELLKRAAPIEKVSTLYGLKNEKGKSLLNEKQIMLLLVFYQLKP